MPKKKTNRSVRAASSTVPPQPVHPQVVQWYTQAHQFLQSGNVPQAKQLLVKAIQHAPNHAESNHLLGVISHQAGDSVNAERMIRKAIKMSPQLWQAHNNLGVVLKDQGKLKQAKVVYLSLLKAQPDYADAHSNLGVIYSEFGDTDRAIRSLERAIILKPENEDAHYTLGTVRFLQGRHELAIEQFEHVLLNNSAHVESRNNLGCAYLHCGQYKNAEVAFDQVIKLRQDHAQALNNRGQARQKLLNFDLAHDDFLKAHQLEKNNPEMLFNLAHNHHEVGEFTQAKALYEQVLALKPDYLDAHSNLLMLANYFDDESVQTTFESHVAWQQRVKQFSKIKPMPVLTRQKSARIKVGYVSADFREHSVAYFLKPLLANHNASKVEVFCYSNNTVIDDMTLALKALAEHWTDVSPLSDKVFAEKVKQDKIDILVDLSGHTSGHRLATFLYKPAPIQVTWLGYPNTSGLSTMDYRLVDAISDPEGLTNSYCSEQLLRLPRGFLCYEGRDSVPYETKPPVLKTTFITFGSFNNLLKVSDIAIQCWAKVLDAVPNSRLLLKSKQLGNPGTLKALSEKFSALGIDTARLDFRAYVDSKHGHLGVYDDVDIALDTFPYNGTTTTFEALWMGVPTVTLAGNRHAARVGASIMMHLGLEDYVAQSIDDYIEIAKAKATDLNALAELRAGLRQQLKQSTLCDGKQFAIDIEAAYADMLAASS